MHLKKPSQQYYCLCRRMASPMGRQRENRENKKETHFCSTQPFTHSLTMNNTATRGLEQEGLPRKRSEGTLVICVEHIFIWTEIERHKIPRRGREVICPDSSFTLLRSKTHTNTKTKECTWMNTIIHTDRDRFTKPSSPPKHIKRSKSLMPSQWCQSVCTYDWVTLHMHCFIKKALPFDCSSPLSETHGLSLRLLVAAFLCSLAKYLLHCMRLKLIMVMAFPICKIC